MSNHILLPNGDTIREDELYHFKYIKREKVGDKWKYYYDTEALKSDVGKVVDTAKNTIDAAKGKVEVAKDKIEVAKDKIEVAKTKINTAKDYVKDKLGFDEKEAAEKASAKANDSSVRAAHEIRNYNQAKKTESETKGLISKHKARQETETARVQAARASRQAGKDRADAAAAREAYANTPIGKVEKAAEKGKEWLKKLIGGKR